MVKPTTARGTKVRLLLEDPANPGTYNALCGITAKTFNFQTNQNEQFIADCDDPDSPPWRVLVKSGRFVSVSGEGLLDTKTAFPRVLAAYNDDDPINARLYIDVPAASGGGYFTATLMLTQFQINGPDGDNTGVSISLESSDAVTWVPAT